MTVTIRIKLKEFLNTHKLRPLHVENRARELDEARGVNPPLGRNTMYRIMGNPEPGKLEMRTMNSILNALTDMLKRPVTIEEIIEFVPDAPEATA